MSVYIRGMEMPTSCYACMFEVYGLCLINKNLEAKDELTHSCPLIPVPEHGDLIDKRGVDVLSWDEKDEGDFKDGVLFVLDKLDELPVIIPEDKGEEG